MVSNPFLCLQVRALITFCAFACVHAHSKTRITDVVLFGDSYTDQSRQHSIANGTYPGKDYQEIFPPADVAANGGVQWPYYLGLYGNYTIWNYAVGGAVCSNALTPFSGEPDVVNGQLAWFAQDHVARDAEGRSRLLRDSDALVVIVFVGTNDVGIKSFVTNDQATNVSLPNVADCQLDALRALQALGVKHFIVNALVPLQLTRLYANDSTGTIYYPATHDGKAWHAGITNLVHSLNRILHDGVGALNRQWEGAAAVSWFNTYDFFWEMYDHPMRYFNGSLPANVTGHCHQCPDPNDYRQCGVGDCTADQRDSFMWWDELHPSEQTGRNLAAEMHRKIEGKSQY